ncbi:MAG: PhoH family protein [Microthrixaceae bacterium]|nr:PhoH family protein [Microthrixaceae bacterium]
MIDTSVLLADPGALARFEEHEVVVPLMVLTELEGKRHHPELGWAARTALRFLEDLRIAGAEDGLRLTDALPVNDAGGTLRVELNHVEASSLPAEFRQDAPDHRILAVARNLADKGLDSVVVTKDLPLRLKAAIAGLDAEEYRNEQVDASSLTGMVTMPTTSAIIDELYSSRRVPLTDVQGDGPAGSASSGASDGQTVPVNSGVVLTGESSSALARLHPDGLLHLVDGDRSLFDVHGRSAEQRVALDLLADERVGIVSLGGPAGTGKSVLALAAGLESVLERELHRRVLVFRPLYAVGGQDLGFLPGDAAEKMNPWAAAVTDALEAIAGPEVIEEVRARQLVEVLPLTHIRGRTLTESFVIVDEAQNLEQMVLLTALSRLGEGSRVVLTHDVAQRDNLHVGRHDGIASVVARLTGSPLFGHVALSRSERSPIAALVSDLLD